MKTLFAAASAVVLLAAAPAFAQTAAGNGYVGAGYARAEVETPVGEAEGDGWFVEGATTFQVSPTLGVQLDASYVNAEDIDTIAGTGHLFTRNDQFAIGGFAGVADVEDATAFTLGVEGQSYVSNALTLAGALGYVNGEDESDGWGVLGEARLFPTDNLRLSAGIGYSEADDIDDVSYGLGAEYQLAAAPLSVFGSWTRTDVSDFDVKADTLLAGVRYNFGAVTLKDRDRRGASFNGLDFSF
jgi:hypothetical protein